MNHINGLPVAPTSISLDPSWRPLPDMSGWTYPMGASIGFLSQQWLTPEIHVPGVAPARLEAGARTPLAGLDALPTLEAQLFTIVAALYDSNEVRGQIGADEYVPPPVPEPEPVIPPVE